MSTDTFFPKYIHPLELKKSRFKKHTKMKTTLSLVVCITNNIISTRMIMLNNCVRSPKNIL